MPPPLREITVSHQHKEKGAIEEQRRGEERRGEESGMERREETIKEVRGERRRRRRREGYRKERHEAVLKRWGKMGV